MNATRFTTEEVLSGHVIALSFDEMVAVANVIEDHVPLAETQEERERLQRLAASYLELAGMGR